jgi:hypothetical protein
MTASQWRAKPGDEEYETMVTDVLFVLERANRFITLNPQFKGIFAGKKIEVAEKTMTVMRTNRKE